MRIAFMLAAASILFMLPAQAQDDDSPNCISGPSDMDACSSPIYTVADAKLNQSYRQLRDVLSAADKIRLRDAERVWITYRDKECTFETSDTVGQPEHLQRVARCLADKTNIHLAELNRILACRQDETECPWQGN